MAAHDFDPTVLREYDIRGIVGKTLKESDAAAVGRAFGTLVRRDGGKSVVVAYDGRFSSPDLEQQLVSGLREVGIDVIRIGLGPTPMLYFSVYHLDADGGIMITGSHNPPDYNGFKMMIGKQPFFGENIQELGRVAASGLFETGEGGESEADIKDAYVERILEGFSGGAINAVWDPGNGAACEVLEALVARLPGRHKVIFGDIDGSFPNHHPDPTEPENLVELQKIVIEEGFDLGIAFDGDGDRIGAVDHTGEIVWGDQLLAIFARDVLRDVPGSTIIADVKASQALFDEIAKLGGEPLMWRTGHSLIKQKMVETNSPLAGEMSGHIFFKHNFYGFDDALFAALRLLSAVSGEERSLADLVGALPKMINTPELRFPCPEERKFEVAKEVQARLSSSDADVSVIDGVRVTNEDGWWLLRASNTQDVLVARCEAKNQAALDRLKATLIEQVTLSGITPPKI